MIISMKHLLRLADGSTFRPIERAKVYLTQARTCGIWKAGGYYVFTDMPFESDCVSISADGYEPCDRKITASDKETVVYLVKSRASDAPLHELTVTANADTGSESITVYADWLNGAELRGCLLKECKASVKSAVDNTIILTAPLSVSLKPGQTLTVCTPEAEI